MSLPTTPRIAVITVLALLVLGPHAALGQAVTSGASPAGEAAATSTSAPGSLELARLREASERHGPVWFRLKPPFEDPAFKAFAFEPRKNTWLALGEVVAVNFTMWQFSYWAGNNFSKISIDTIGQNFRKGWIIDTDPYWVNQFGHPLEGALFYTAARSTGHNFYESFGAAFLGSLMWEQFMEVQSPSVNDQITTPMGGTMLGEVMHRMYRLILDSGGEKPSAWRQFSAFLVSPVDGVNRFFSGDTYRGEMLLPPSWIGQFSAGMVVAASAVDRRTGAPLESIDPCGSIGLRIIYGVPGTPGLRLRQPMDHFDARFWIAFAGKAETTAALMLNGLIIGDTIGTGEGFGGLWGLFASYDAIGVPVFKASGVGFGPGVGLMGRWDWFELHGTAALQALPWATGGSINTLFARDYHVGPGAKGRLELRAAFGDRVMLDLGVREIYISGWYASGSDEDLTYGNAALTVRIYGPHAITGQALWGRRHATYKYEPAISQDTTIWSAYYTLLQGW